MAPQLYNATELTAGQHGWSVIIQVMHRFPAQTSNTGHKFRKYVFTDMQGTIIGAVIFGQSISLFENLFQTYKRYKISNARIEKADPLYKISDYNCSWIISNRTPVELLDDPIPYTLPCSLPTVSISQLQKYAAKDVSIDVAALVVQRLPEIQQTPQSIMKNYVLITEEKLPIILTLWVNLSGSNTCLIDDDVQLPKFFIGRNLKVTTYNGLSLTTKKLAYMMNQPPVSVAQKMIEWYESSSDNQTICNLLHMHHNVQRFFSLDQTTDVLNIKNAKKELPNLHTAWVKGNLQFVPTEKKPWTVICGFCTKVVDADPGDIMTCIYCQQKEATIVGSNLTFKFYDKTDDMIITAQYPVTNDVIHITTNEIKSLAEQENLSSTLDELLKNKTFACFIKLFSSTANQRQMPHYSVLEFSTFQNQDSNASDITSLHASSSAVEVEALTMLPEDLTANTPPDFPTLPNPKRYSESALPESTKKESAIRKRLQFDDTPGLADNEPKKTGRY